MIVELIFLLIASIRADSSSFSNVNFTFELEPVDECVNERYRVSIFTKKKNKNIFIEWYFFISVTNFLNVHVAMKVTYAP